MKAADCPPLLGLRVHPSHCLSSGMTSFCALKTAVTTCDNAQALAEAQQQRAGAAAALRALGNALERMRAERALAAETAAALTAALAEAARRSHLAPEAPMASVALAGETLSGAACRADAGTEAPTKDAPRPTCAGPLDKAARHMRGASGGHQAAEACGASGGSSAERGARAAGARAGPLADAEAGAARRCVAGTPAALQGGSSAGDPAQHAELAPASACAAACPVPGHWQATGRQSEPEGHSGRPSGEGLVAARLAGRSSAEAAGVGVDAPRQLSKLAEPAACSGAATPGANWEPDAAGGGRGSAHRASGDAGSATRDDAAPRFLTLAELAAAPLSVPLGEPMRAPDRAPGPGERGAHAAAAGRAPLLARGPCREPDQARRVSTWGRPAEHEAARVQSPGASGRRLGKEIAGGGRRAGCLRSSAELSALLAASRAHARCSARSGVC